MKSLSYLCNIIQNFVSSKKVLDAFCIIDRAIFVPEEYKDLAYEDTVIPLKEGVTISQPSLLAYMIDLLDIKEGDKILEIGTGSGYSTAILSKLVGRSGKIISIDIDEYAIDYANRKLSELVEKDVIFKNYVLVLGDGTLGYPKEAPYDKIIIHTALPRIPNLLVWQLKDKGIIVAPIGKVYDQRLVVAIKDRGSIKIEEKIPVLFVPSKGKYGFYDIDDK